jgi:uncharacterized membrane-anchored protein YhcB (DUF1043 family)
MIGKSSTRTKLCPYCANSVPEDATNCAYCKADLASEIVPQWLKRDKAGSEPRNSSANQKGFSIPPNFIWIGAILVVALAAFLAGGYLQRNQLQLSTQAFSKQVQAKNQMIQTQETQLAQTRQQLNENSNQLAEMETKLEESRKELSLTQQRLKAATREVDDRNASRPANVGRTAARAPDTAASPPQPVSARRTAEPGAYETTRATSVYENPSPSARVISQIGPRTRINVVSSSGDWLEVRSKRGNPPGYVRSGDARQVARAN